jgi:hypothetical protein
MERLTLGALFFFSLCPSSWFFSLKQKNNRNGEVYGGFFLNCEKTIEGEN